jgi:GMP synthase-like glutamine amidotransferase
MRLLVLDNAIDHEMYRPVEHWTCLAGFVPDSVYVPSGAELPPPGAHTHVIVSGSESSIVERAAWVEAELRWVQQAAARGVRILGSCWGHQLIAAALGGPRCVRRSPTPELGWQHIDVLPRKGDEPADLLPCSFDSFVSHFDEVVPGCHAELRVLASSPGCAVHALRWGDLPVWGVQAHPEIDPQTGRGFLELALRRWPEHAPLFRAALDRPVRDSRIGRALVERFLAA